MSILVIAPYYSGFKKRLAGTDFTLTLIIVLTLSALGARESSAAESQGVQEPTVIGQFRTLDELIRAKKLAECAQELDRIIAANQNNPAVAARALIYKARLLVMLNGHGDNEPLELLGRAEQMLKASTAKSPEWQSSCFLLVTTRALVLARMGQPARAREEIARMLDDREISLSMRAWLVGQFSQYLEMEGRDHAEMYTNVMSALAAKYGESELAGNVYLAWAERLIRQGAFKEAEEKLELARNILGYLVTRDVQLELDGSSRHVTEPPSDYAFYNQAALVWFFPGGPNGYQDVFLAGGVTEAQVEPGHWERAFADAEKVLAEESEPRTRRIVAHLIKVLVLKQQGKYDLVLAELDKTEKECAELEMKGPFEDSFAGEAEFLRGRVLQAQGRQREAQSLYEKMVGNTDLPLSTRQVAVSGLASLIGSRTADGAEKAVAERMQMLMRDAQPAEFKRHIEVAWAEWLIENGNYYAAGKILREAAGVVGEMSADVKEAQFLLKKRGAPKAEEGLSPEP